MSVELTQDQKDDIRDNTVNTADRLTAKQDSLVANIDLALLYKVNKVDGKGLSENDFTTELKDKLEDLSGTIIEWE